MKNFFEKYGAILLAIVLACALAFIYCKPEHSGKVLQPGDNVNAVSNLQEIYRYKVDSWWTGALFSGMPTYQIGGNRYNSDRLMSPFSRFLYRGIGSPTWTLIFYFLCFALLMRCFGINKWLSIVGGIAIGLSSYFLIILAAGHFTKPVSLTYIPLVAAGFFLLFRKKYLLGSIMVMFFTAIGFSLHPQMSYYLFMMIGVFFLAELYQHIREKRWKDLGIATLLFVLSLGIGLGTGCSSVYANREYTQETMRGGHSDLVSDASDSQKGVNGKGLDIDYATQWSYGIDESFSFLIPGFKGGSTVYPLGPSSNTYKTARALGLSNKNALDFANSAPVYWGDQSFTAGNVYMGAIICFLFLLGCLIVPGPYKWALLASSVLSIMLAWGHNCMWLTELFFNYFPFYNKFRAVSSILVVAEIAMPLLGFLALKALSDGSVSKEKARKGILIAGGVTAGLCLFFALFGKSLYGFIGPYDENFASQIPHKLYDAIIADRAALLTGDAWRSFFFIVAAGVLVYFFNEKKIKLMPLVIGLGVLILADMWPVDKRYFNDSYFQNPISAGHVYDKQPWEEALLQDPDPHFRIMNLTTNTFNESRSNYYLKSIGGYHAAKLRRYQDLIDEHLSQLHLPVIGMLNAKYLIVPDEDGQTSIQLNPYALGNAWFVESLVMADNANEEINALTAIDLSNTAVFDSSFADYISDTHPGIAPDAQVHLTAYTPKQIDYDYTSSQPGTIVFSEIYYPYGWKASIDGQKAEHFRVNYALRALNVPAGKHHVTFLFDPDSVRKGDTIASICILLMYLIMLAGAVWGIYNLFKKEKA